MVRKSFDLIVVGGGTGGLRAAFHSALSGKKTALVEPGVLGGTCLNFGCIPTKALLHAAKLYNLASKAYEFGIQSSKPKINFSKLMGRVHSVVHSGQEHIKTNTHIKNLFIYKHPASFTDKNSVRVGRDILFARRILISTGSKPRIPDISGMQTTPFLTSKEALNLRKLPKSIGIIGGGYIALEFATFFNRLGSKVTIIGRAPRILPRIDPEISNVLTEEYTKRGVVVKTGAEVSAISKKGTKKQITYTSNNKTSTITVDEVLFAVGRIPTTASLNLPAAGVAVDSRDAIKVNSHLQTTNKSIYALGDVTAKACFAHTAKRASDVVLQNMFSKKKVVMPFWLVPWAVFTDPPIAGVGKSEFELQKNKIPYKVLTTSFSKIGRTQIEKETTGTCKVYYNPKTKKILGATLFGLHADEIVHEYAALILKKATITDLQQIIHVHPTVSEVSSSFNWPS